MTSDGVTTYFVAFAQAFVHYSTVASKLVSPIRVGPREESVKFCRSNEKNGKGEESICESNTNVWEKIGECLYALC